MWAPYGKKNLMRKKQPTQKNDKQMYIYFRCKISKVQNGFK